MARIKVYRYVVLGQGVLQIALPLEHEGQVAMRFGLGRLKLDRRAEFRDGARRIAFVSKNKPKIIVS